MSIYMWREGPEYLCFTANTAGSTIELTKISTPNSITIEKSTDRENRSTYTFGTSITLNNIGDKIYLRNTSDTPIALYSSTGWYQFSISGSVDGNGDITTLLCKNGTANLPTYCFQYLFNGCTGIRKAEFIMPISTSEGCYANMFQNCTNLIVAPSLPATTLSYICYANMFKGCSNLTVLPKLPATILANTCYSNMFRGCSGIKISTTQTGIYQTEYRIPTTGTGSGGDTYSLNSMFTNTGGTFTGTPSVNTNYYTSNTLV